MASEKVGIGTYRDDVVEKVWRLSRVLDALSGHPMLAGNLALHGGTALNLFILDPRRLSLDLDLNYIASEDRGQMLRDQTDYVSMVCDVGTELGFDAEAGRIGHAGCTIKLRYSSEVTGLPDFVKVDLDFINRTCLMPPREMAMTYEGIDARFLVNSPVEVVGGKVRAAASRTVPRDLYDLVRIGEDRGAWTTGDPLLDHRVVFYNAVLSNRFPNHGDLADRTRFEGRERDFDQILRPVLPADSALTYDALLDGAIDVLAEFAHPLDEVEEEFAVALAKGELNTSTLFVGHPELAERASRNPVALHKCNNIRSAIRRGLITT